MQPATRIVQPATRRGTARHDAARQGTLRHGTPLAAAAATRRKEHHLKFVWFDQPNERKPMRDDMEQKRNDLKHQIERAQANIATSQLQLDEAKRMLKRLDDGIYVKVGMRVRNTGFDVDDRWERTVAPKDLCRADSIALWRNNGSITYARPSVLETVSGPGATDFGGKKVLGYDPNY